MIVDRCVPRLPLSNSLTQSVVHTGRVIRTAFALVVALVFAIGLGAGLARPAHAQAEVVIDFDAFADGTVIDNAYGLSDPPLTFSNPLGGSVYARSFGYNTSAPNVVSIYPTGAPPFNAEDGAVDVEIGWSSGQIPVYSVSVQVAAVSLLELVQPTKRPFMQVWDSAGVLRATVYFQGALPSGVLSTSPYETLSFALPPCGSPPCVFERIGKVRLSAQVPAGTPPIFGLFDDLTFNPAPPSTTCSDLLVINGDGTACDGTAATASCSVWTCPVDYSKQGGDPVCQSDGTWSGPAVCVADFCFGEPLLPYGSSTGCTGLPNGSVCTTWSCDSGYVALGSDPFCVDGGWSGDFGCYPVAPVPVASPGAQVVLAGAIAVLGLITLVALARRASPS